MSELPIIQKTYELIKWYVPILNRLPKEHKFTLGERMVGSLYDLLGGLILARYAPDKRTILTGLNTQLDILRYQSRLLLDFQLIQQDRYARATQLMTDIGKDLGGWTKQQKAKQPELRPEPRLF
jgi:hypothetical protein